jgi:hypothetical protein
MPKIDEARFWSKVDMRGPDECYGVSQSTIRRLWLHV